MFNQITTAIATFFTAILVTVGISQPIPSPTPIPTPIPIPIVQPTPEPTVLATATPSATPSPTATISAQKELITCTGPDSKQFQATQDDCDEFLEAWGIPKDEELKQTAKKCDPQQIKKEIANEVNKNGLEIKNLGKKLSEYYNDNRICKKQPDPDCIILTKEDEQKVEELKKELRRLEDIEPDKEKIKKLSNQLKDCENE